MPGIGEGGCDRLKALEGALFCLDLTNSLTNSGSWAFQALKHCKLKLVNSLHQNHLPWQEPAAAGGRWVPDLVLDPYDVILLIL